MEESSNKDLTLEEVKQRKSIRLVQAQFLESTGQSSEAEKAYTETAQDEEWIVKELKRTGHSSTDFVANLISAASCWKKSGNYDRAFELIDEVLQAADVEPQWKQEGSRLRDEWRQYLRLGARPIHDVDKRSPPPGNSISDEPIAESRPSLFQHVPDYLTQDLFEGLLNWLHPDRETAGEKFTAIHQRLISMFVQRGFSDAEDLADETMVRVSRQLPKIASSYHGNPALYFYGVGRRVMMQSARRKPLVPVQDVSNDLLASDSLSRPDSNLELQYFEHCLNRLHPEKCDLLIAYYEQSDKGRIAQRKELAQQIGVSLNGLRLRIHQIRNELRECMKERYEGETSK